MLNAINPECVHTILSFLQVRDILNVGAASRESLESILPTLTEIHRELFYSSRQSVREQEQDLATPADVFSTRTTLEGAGKHSNDGMEQPQSPSCSSIQLPTLQEILETLADVIPPKYSHRDKIQALRGALVLTTNTSTTTAVTATNNHDAYDTSLPRLRRITLCFRLLRDLLLLVGQRCNDTIQLHQYIGDVYCTLYLHGTIAPSLLLRSCCGIFFVQDNKVADYRNWTERHAFALQHVLTNHQRQRYGVLNLPYDSFGLSSFEATTTATPFNLSSATLTLIYDDFAPLGPQFRGRDIVRTLDISRSQMTKSSAREWIVQAHEQCRIHRPMTVRPPEVRLG